MALAAVVMMISPFASAISSVAVKRWGEDVHPFSLTAVPMLMAAVIMGALAVGWERDRAVVWDGVSLSALLYLAIVVYTTRGLVRRHLAQQSGHPFRLPGAVDLLHICTFALLVLVTDWVPFVLEHVVSVPLLSSLDSARSNPDLFRGYVLRFEGNEVSPGLLPYATESGGAVFQIAAGPTRLRGIVQAFADVFAAAQGYAVQPLERGAFDTRSLKRLDSLFGQAPGLSTRPLNTEHPGVRRLAQLAVTLGVLAQGGGGALLVQDVIGDLKGEPDPGAVVGDRL